MSDKPATKAQIRELMWFGIKDLSGSLTEQQATAMIEAATKRIDTKRIDTNSE